MAGLGCSFSLVDDNKTSVSVVCEPGCLSHQLLCLIPGVWLAGNLTQRHPLVLAEFMMGFMNNKYIIPAAFDTSLSYV